MGISSLRDLTAPFVSFYRYYVPNGPKRQRSVSRGIQISKSAIAAIPNQTAEAETPHRMMVTANFCLYVEWKESTAYGEDFEINRRRTRHGAKPVCEFRFDAAMPVGGRIGRYDDDMAGPARFVVCNGNNRGLMPIRFVTTETARAAALFFRLAASLVGQDIRVGFRLATRRHQICFRLMPAGFNRKCATRVAAKTIPLRKTRDTKTDRDNQWDNSNFCLFCFHAIP